MAEDVIIKARIEADTTNATKGIDNVNQSLKGANKEATNSSGMFGNLKKTLGEISPAADAASKGAGMFNTALNVLKANPIIAVISLIVLVVAALFEKFKKMEGVSDSLGKAFGKLSGVFNTFINAILTPLIDGFVFLVDLWTNSVIAILDAVGITSAKTAERFGEITEALDDLEDAEKDAALAMAESNRKLQEAREVAADANVPIKERIEALKLAGKIEKEELDNVVRINQTKAKLVMESIAMELGAKDSLIAKIREGSLESLKAARLELANMKNVDKEKLYAIDAQIIAAENAAAQSAKIGKKTDAAIRGLQKEQEAKDKEIADKKKAQADKELAELNKYLAVKNKLTNEANLAAITDDVLLAKQKIANAEKDKLKEIDLLKTSENNKAELRAMIHKSSLEEIAKIDREVKIKKAKEEEALEEQLAQERKKIESDRLKKTIEANEKRAEALMKADDEHKKKLEEQRKLGLDITQGGMSKEQLELLKLEETYKQKLAIAQGNEALITAVINENEEAKTKIKQDAANQQLNESVRASEALIGVLGKETAVGKGLGIANALINTYQGATDALRAKSTLPSPFDVIAKIANVAAVLGSGFKAVKAITAVQVPGGGGGGSMPTMPAPVSPQQISTALNQSSINAVGNAAQGGVNRAFVLSSDISNDADKMARINRAARLG